MAVGCKGRYWYIIVCAILRMFFLCLFKGKGVVKVSNCYSLRCFSPPIRNSFWLPILPSDEVEGIGHSQDSTYPLSPRPPLSPCQQPSLCLPLDVFTKGDSTGDDFLDSISSNDHASSLLDDRPKMFPHRLY